MQTKYTQISLSYSIAGELLAKAGIYQEAQIITVNAFAKKNYHSWKEENKNKFKKGIEELVIVKPMNVIAEPVYKVAKKHVILPESFINYALTNLPFKKGASDKEMNIIRNWANLSNEARLDFHINQYVTDMNGYNGEYELQ
jgi:uncharacterized protein YdeI (YjbR/CyaY-like superfamily)